MKPHNPSATPTGAPLPVDAPRAALRATGLYDTGASYDYDYDDKEAFLSIEVSAPWSPGGPPWHLSDDDDIA